MVKQIYDDAPVEITKRSGTDDYITGLNDETWQVFRAWTQVEYGESSFLLVAAWHKPVYNKHAQGWARADAFLIPAPDTYDKNSRSLFAYMEYYKMGTSLTANTPQRTWNVSSFHTKNNGFVVRKGGREIVEIKLAQKFTEAALYLFNSLHTRYGI